MSTTAKFFFILLGLYIAYNMVDKFDPDSIKGKRVIVTGASTGIGEELAYSYAKLGARLLITARRENILQQVVQKCMELGAQEAHYIPLDMGNMSHTKILIEEAEQRFHGLDILILNHIAGNKLELWNGQFDRLNGMFDVNFKAYVHLATYALPMLKKSNGSITVMSSFAGKCGQPYTAAYSASKFALGGFFEALRQEFTMQDINVSITICIIGSIKTENAIKFSKEVMNTDIFATSASDTAEAVMRGTYHKQLEAYYPWGMTRPTAILKELFPKFIFWICRLVFTTSGDS
ncbi:hydroxysteroid 11-beta-dehydrogenase 1-like protein [Ptychodera flava]|uniref:hydroxysteroid 11-beta-dehydrogenase 1-like protein n=1 Tax=Ptychodera flava TaxID=63121 RepID=UPI003969F8EF